MASGVDVGGVTFMGPWQRAFLYGLGYLPYWCSIMALAWGCSNTFGSILAGLSALEVAVFLYFANRYAYRKKSEQPVALH